MCFPSYTNTVFLQSWWNDSSHVIFISQKDTLLSSKSPTTNIIKCIPKLAVGMTFYRFFIRESYFTIMSSFWNCFSKQLNSESFCWSSLQGCSPLLWGPLYPRMELLVLFSRPSGHRLVGTAWAGCQESLRQRLPFWVGWVPELLPAVCTVSVSSWTRILLLHLLI